MKKLIQKFITDKHGNVVVWQWPNFPITIWAICTLAAKVAAGPLHTLFSAVGTTALIIWAMLEIISGASYFRRALGLVVLGFTTYLLLTTY